MVDRYASFILTPRSAALLEFAFSKERYAARTGPQKQAPGPGVRGLIRMKTSKVNYSPADSIDADSYSTESRTAGMWEHLRPWVEF